MQEQNRAEALLRLIDLKRQAAQRPKPRKKTRSSASAKARRLDEKRQRRYHVDGYEQLSKR